MFNGWNLAKIVELNQTDKECLYFIDRKKESIFEINQWWNGWASISVEALLTSENLLIYSVIIEFIIDFQICLKVEKQNLS